MVDRRSPRSVGKQLCPSMNQHNQSLSATTDIKPPLIIHRRRHSLFHFPPPLNRSINPPINNSNRTESWLVVSKRYLHTHTAALTMSSLYPYYITYLQSCLQSATFPAIDRVPKKGTRKRQEGWELDIEEGQGHEVPMCNLQDRC
jgi:hypothetical protein